MRMACMLGFYLGSWSDSEPNGLDDCPKRQVTVAKATRLRIPGLEFLKLTLMIVSSEAPETRCTLWGNAGINTI